MMIKDKLAIALFSLGLGGCTSLVTDEGGDSDDLSEIAIRLDDGTFDCAAPKVLVCHIPPGNPENAHEICIGAAAVPAHQTNHFDPLGACDPGEDDPTGDDPTGDDPTGDDPTGDDPTGDDPTCTDPNGCGPNETAVPPTDVYDPTSDPGCEQNCDLDVN